MSACSSGCGWCGGCSAAWEREAPEPEYCDYCGEEVATGAVRLTSGLYCSSRCVDANERARVRDLPAHLIGAGE